jgi:hypothetical protein
MELIYHCLEVGGFPHIQLKLSYICTFSLPFLRERQSVARIVPAIRRRQPSKNSAFCGATGSRSNHDRFWE